MVAYRELCIHQVSSPLLYCHYVFLYCNVTSARRSFPTDLARVFLGYRILVYFTLLYFTN